MNAEIVATLEEAYPLPKTVPDLNDIVLMIQRVQSAGSFEEACAIASETSKQVEADGHRFTIAAKQEDDGWSVHINVH